MRWTQAGLGLPQDGKVGPKTLSAAQEAVQNGDGKSLLMIVDARVTFLVALVRRVPTQVDFLLGWWRRTLRVLGRAILSSDEDQT